MNPTTHLTVITERHDQRSVLRLQGELDASNRDLLHSAICSALENYPPLLVVDLSGLGFIDCAALSVLVWAHKRLAGCGRRLVITGAQPAAQRLLDLTGLATYLHLSSLEALSSRADEGVRA
jgi:anti-anti-sigma factor